MGKFGKLLRRVWKKLSTGTFTQWPLTAVFDPAGLLGRIYWYALYPLHQLVFRDMLKGIAREAIR